MLILSRRPGESIVIGNQVTVTVLDVRGDQIRIGVDAPREVQVHREEIHQELTSENTGAAASSARARDAIARMPGARRPQDDRDADASEGTSDGDDAAGAHSDRGPEEAGDAATRRDRPFRPSRGPGDI